MKLTAWILAVIAAFALFMTVDDATTEKIDPYIVGLIGGTLLVVGVIMLAFTPNWSARGLGIVSVSLGCAVLYLGSLMFYVEPATKRWFNPVTDLARAFLVVGGPLLVFGILRWLNSTFNPQDPIE